MTMRCLPIEKDDEGKEIGEKLGFFPIKTAPCRAVDEVEYGRKRIVGYPGDKPYGTMWTSGICDNWNHDDCNGLTVHHKCDTYPGNSGSGILLHYKDGSIGVVGVHSHGFSGSGQWNSGPAFTMQVAETLRSLIEREPTKTCLWTAWLEECSNSGTGTLVQRSSLTDFQEAMTRLGNEGKHLVAADYSDGTWIGFCEELPGAYRWVTRSNWGDFLSEASYALNNDYRAEAMVAGDGVYLAWYRVRAGVISAYSSGDGNANFQQDLNERMDEGMYMTAGLHNDHQ